MGIAGVDAETPIAGDEFSFFEEIVYLFFSVEVTTFDKYEFASQFADG